jgi:hypothetical protein
MAAVTFVYSLRQLCHFVLYNFFLYSSSCPRFTLCLFLCIPLYTPTLRSVASPFRDATARSYRFRWFSRPNCRRPYRLHRYSTVVPGLDSQQNNRHSFLSPRCPAKLQAHETSYAINTSRSVHIVLFYVYCVVLCITCCSMNVVLFYVS